CSSTLRRPPTSTIFPYTTLFRSHGPPRQLSSKRVPVAIVGPQTPWRQTVCRVFQGVKASAAIEKSVILLCLFPLPNALLAIRVVGVVVVLVNRGHDGRSIHDNRPGCAGEPHEPVIPAWPPDDKRRKLLQVETAVEGKIIDPLWRALAVCF